MKTTSAKPRSLIAILEERRDFNDKFVEYHFELKNPATFQFRAGQFISVKVNEIGARRAYSIVSPPSFDHGFKLLVDLSPGGIGSQFFSSLKPGDKINALGPMGSFQLINQPEAEAHVFVATGSGIAPFRSMIEDLLIDHQDKREIRLYWGLRHEQTLFWENDFQDWVESHKNFAFYPVISQPTANWPLSTGHVTDLILAHQFSPQTDFYLCGNVAMINDLSKVLLETKKILPDQIHTEQY